MKLSRINDFKREVKKASRRSGIAKKWAGWNDVSVCDNCGRTRQEARIYKNKRIPYYIVEREPNEVHERQDVQMDLCEICLAFVEEQGRLP